VVLRHYSFLPYRQALRNIFTLEGVIWRIPTFYILSIGNVFDEVLYFLFVSFYCFSSLLLLEFGSPEKCGPFHFPPFLFLMISQQKSYELKACACCATI